MRVLLPALAVLAILAAPASAQEQKLYNSNNRGGTTLYNSGSSGARPLDLKQITQGRNNTGYVYNRGGTGYTPYGANTGATSGLYPTLAEVEAFRARRSAEAQAQQQASMKSLQQIHDYQRLQDQNLPPQMPGAAAGMATDATGAAQTPYTMAPVKKVQRYKGRDTGVEAPPKVFNSVR